VYKKAIASMTFSAFVRLEFFIRGQMRAIIVAVGIAGLLVMSTAAARSQDYVVTIKNHRFSPAEIKVPANQRITITVVNEDATPEEFESNVLKVEKVVAGKSKGVVRIGPLKPGRYPFVGEYNEATAKGVIIAE
jgi:Cupredoxin-like domain